MVATATALGAAALLPGLAPSASANSDRSLADLEERLVSLYQARKDSVVKVKVATRAQDETGENRFSLTVLSGFFIDPQGTVLTNAIPQTEGTRVWIERQGLQLLAITLGVDRKSNLGLIKAAKPPSQLSYIDLEDAAEQIPVGAFAFAITSPLDFAPTPKWGMVSGKESSFSDVRFPFTYTRINIPSGPAEGGSPVFDRRGRLMGISVATLPDIDSSYIVPAKPLRHIVSTLLAKGTFRHPDLRIRLEERTLPTLGETQVVVREIEPNSSAAESGLKPGDLLLRIGDRPVTSANQARDAVFFGEIGAFLTLTVQRGNEELEFAVLLEADEA